MSRIRPLPPEAISQIHSSNHITSLQGVILSLLENSLDAGSSKVEITADFRRGGCVVEDNGLGIPSSEFAETSGGLGRMYHTSKRASLLEHDLHGSTGTYLASLAALSLLSITSKHVDDSGCATLVLHQGKVIGRQRPSALGHELTMSASQGTRVTVRDLFGNMPVRVKQRALAADSGADDHKAWQELKRGIVALLLAWHKPCSIRLRDAEIPARSLNLTPQHPTVSAALTEKSLNELSGAVTKFDLKDVLPMVFQAGLAPPDSRNSFIPLSASASGLSVKGAICLEPAPTKQCQFISIGVRPCSTGPGHGDVYDAVNKVFTNSSFGSIEDESEVDEVEKDRRKRDRRYKSHGFTRKQLHVRKGVDRWPMFILQVRFTESMRKETQTAETLSDASLKATVEILEATVTQWLASHHFRPRKRTRRKNDEQEGPLSSQNPSPTGSGRRTPNTETPLRKRSVPLEAATTSKKRKIMDLSGRLHGLGADVSLVLRNSNGCFNSWSRIKSGKDAFYGEVFEGKKPATAPSGRSGAIASPAPKPKLIFNLPPLEAGELSCKTKRLTITTAESAQDETPTAWEPVAMGREPNSSTDFGSVDNDEMLDVAQSVESAYFLTDVVAAVEDPGVPCVDEETLDDQNIDWTDPVTKEVHKINARTGVVLPSRPRPSTLDIEAQQTTPQRRSAAIKTGVSSAGRSLTLSKRPSTASKDGQNRWLPGFLKEWSNPIFVRQEEERIPIASFEGPGIEAAEVAARRCSHHTQIDCFAEAGTAGISRLSKSLLKGAKVIKQVDRKFILCKAEQSEGGDLLLLVDQHAASERIILEGLLAELCTPVAESATKSRSLGKTVHLEKGLRFQVSAPEHRLFEEHAIHFAEWGILYDLYLKREDRSPSQVRPPKDEHTIFVKALPPAIAERCTLIPKLLINLLRSEIWNLADPSNRAPSNNPPLSHDHSVEEHSWLRRIGSCPPGLLEMLNSRACRSAIMFNDGLTFEQCEVLLGDLSRCAFPFMCAHGRVSMVPLVELGGGSGFGGGGDDASSMDVVGLRDAFKRWHLGGRNG